jgi:hypothetical protein
MFSLGGENTALEFTSFGLVKFMKAAHFQYYEAGIEDLCHDEKAARKRWEKVKGMSLPLTSPEFAFPLLAAWRLNPAEAKPRIAAALDQVHKALDQADAKSKPELGFLEAMLLRASGQEPVALDRFQAILRSGDDAWLRYFALVEIQQVFSGLK